MADELEELKEKRALALRQRLSEKKEQEEQQAQAELQLENVLRSAMAPEAKARLSNVKIVNKELYWKAAQAIFYLFQNGKLEGKIQDNETRVTEFAGISGVVLHRRCL